MPKNEFYLRYYVGHKGKFGHEFLEFEFRPDGTFKLIDVSSFTLIGLIIDFHFFQANLGMPTTQTTKMTP